MNQELAQTKMVVRYWSYKECGVKTKALNKAQYGYVLSYNREVSITVKNNNAYS